MTYASNIIISYPENIFLSTHDTRKYPLGFMAAVQDVTNDFETIMMYVKSGASIIDDYKPQQINGGFVMGDVVSGSVSNMKVVVPQYDFGPDQYGFVLYKGKGKSRIKASVDGMNANDYFKPDVQFTTGFIDIGPLITNYTFGFSLENMSPSENKVVDIVLLGKEGQIST